MSDTVVPLGSLTVRSRDSLADVITSGGCPSSGCGKAAGAGDMPAHIWAKIKDHPCYAEEAHHYFARMHVAVAPACNIQCNYCNRKYDCANESRPGVVSERLTPEQAARKVVAVANEVPQLAVLGIAGPGDSCYDWQKTRATLELVREQVPDIKLCLSTNGLALPDHVDEIADLRVDHVTITINTIDPAIGEAIYPWIFWQGRRRTGREASEILIERQLQGLEMLVARGVLVKVNSVMIPGINDAHLKQVNAAVKQRGAFLHNIMPLISAPEHGTVFGLNGQRGPSASELKALQDACSGGANLMRHCRQCRADAVGLLGEDRGQAFQLDQIAGEVAYDPSRRAAYQAWVEGEREDRRQAAAAAKAETEGAVGEQAAPLLVAVCTRGGGRINQHFGHATEFQVFEVDARGVRFVGHRRADKYCLGGQGDDDRLGTAIAALEGVPVVLCARIGGRPRDRLAEAGIQALDSHPYEYIETAVSAVYRDRQRRAAATAAVA